MAEKVNARVKENVTLLRGKPQDNYDYFQEIDLCPSCFNERLIPWLKHEGAKISDPVDW